MKDSILVELPGGRRELALWVKIWDLKFDNEVGFYVLHPEIQKNENGQEVAGDIRPSWITHCWRWAPVDQPSTEWRAYFFHNTGKQVIYLGEREDTLGLWENLEQVAELQKMVWEKKEFRGRVAEDVVRARLEQFYRWYSGEDIPVGVKWHDNWDLWLQHPLLDLDTVYLSELGVEDSEIEEWRNI
jgi:hypothetical protein